MEGVSIYYFKHVGNPLAIRCSKLSILEFWSVMEVSPPIYLSTEIDCYLDLNIPLLCGIFNSEYSTSCPIPYQYVFMISVT